MNEQAKHIDMTSGEASSGGLQGILKIEGHLVSHERIKNKFRETKENGKPENDMIEVSLEDVVVLEMAPGEEEPTLRDDKFSFVIGYAPPDKPNANKNTFWHKGYVASAEALKKTPKEFEGTRVVFEKKTVKLFTRTNKDTQESEEITSTNFVFIDPKDAGNVVDLPALVKEQVVGKNKPAALRAVMVHNRLKTHPEFRTAITNDTLSELVPEVLMVDGIYVDVMEGVKVAEDTDTQDS